MGKKLADGVARLTVFATVIAFSYAPSMAAGPTKLTPDNPKWGDTVTVTYDPAAKGAKFLPGDAIFVCYNLIFPDFSTIGAMKMDRKDGEFRSDIRIPEGAGYISVDFYTMDSWDAKAVCGSMIFRKEGAPAEGAWQGKMGSDSPESGYLDAFRKERELYPQNFSVYRNKWFIDGAFKENDQKAIVGREIGALKEPGVKESPGLLRSLSYGYLLLDDEKASREVLRRMVRIFPDNAATTGALDDYDYQAFSKQIQGEGPEEIKRLKLDLLGKNPGSKLLHSILEQISYEKDAPLDLVRVGCEVWMKDEPDDPRPYYTLASAFLKKNGDLNEASALIRKALDRLIAGKLRTYGDISGAMTEMCMPAYCATAAEVHEKLGDFAAAIADIKAAQTLSKKISPNSFAREGSIWRSLGYFGKAEEALLEARRRGAKSADGELRAIYRQRHQTDEGFDAWLAEKTKKQPSAAPGDKNPAPLFEVKTLDGETLRLADLKGKVVVLNFWYIGCAPCRVEMPGLNKLVEEFKPGEVVFIGFALDDESHLREFLKKTPFIYKIVAGSSSIAGHHLFQLRQ